MHLHTLGWNDMKRSDALTHVHTAERTESRALAMLTGDSFKKIIENGSLKHHKQETIATKKHVSRVSGKKPKRNQSKALLGLTDAGRVAIKQLTRHFNRFFGVGGQRC